VSLGGFDGAAPVRGREEAEGDRDTSVEVQIDFFSAQENSSRMPFDVPKGRQEGVSCFFWKKKGEWKERIDYASGLVFPMERRREVSGGAGIEQEEEKGVGSLGVWGM
jgi:hypothetical protein